MPREAPPSCAGERLPLFNILSLNSQGLFSFRGSVLAGNPEDVFGCTGMWTQGRIACRHGCPQLGWTLPTCDHYLQGVTDIGLHRERPVEFRTRVGPGMFSGHRAKGEGIEMMSLELGETGPNSF